MHILTCSVILGGYPSVDISLVRFWECLGSRNGVDVVDVVDVAGADVETRQEIFEQLLPEETFVDRRLMTEAGAWCIEYWVKKYRHLYWLLYDLNAIIYWWFPHVSNMCSYIRNMCYSWMISNWQMFFFGGETTKQMRVGRMLGNLYLTVSLSMRMER